MTVKKLSKKEQKDREALEIRLQALERDCKTNTKAYLKNMKPELMLLIDGYIHPNAGARYYHQRNLLQIADHLFMFSRAIIYSEKIYKIIRELTSSGEWYLSTYYDTHRYVFRRGKLTRAEIIEKILKSKLLEYISEIKIRENTINLVLTERE